MKQPGWVALLGFAALCAGCSSVLSNLSAESAYPFGHAIVSPRVPLYRLDAHRRIDVEFVYAASASSRLWFVDAARGIDSPLDQDASPECPYAHFGPPGMFDAHYAFDQPDLLVFAERGLVKAVFVSDGKEGWGLALRMLVSSDGGRSFGSRQLIMESPVRWLPAEERYDNSDRLLELGTSSSAVRFLVVRKRVAYLGIAGARPPHASGLKQADVNRDYFGDQIAILAFDPESPARQIPVRLLRGAELRSFALPDPGDAVHAVDAGLLARVRIPGGVAYYEDERRAYVESLRNEFPDWAARQKPKIGRLRYETNSQRSKRIEAAEARGDQCMRHE